MASWSLWDILCETQKYQWHWDVLSGAWLSVLKYFRFPSLWFGSLSPWFSALLLNPPSGCRQGPFWKVLLSKAQPKPISCLTSDNSNGVSAKSLNLISLQLQIFPNGFLRGGEGEVTKNHLYELMPDILSISSEMYFVWQFLFIK